MRSMVEGANGTRRAWVRPSHRFAVPPPRFAGREKIQNTFPGPVAA
jgi:hypothetical protein